MARKVVIDVEARFQDNITDDAQTASEAVGDIGEEAKKAAKETDRLGKKKARPHFDVEDSKFVKKMRDAEAKAKAFAKSKFSAFFDAKDKASSVIGNIVAKAKNFAGKSWSAIIAAKDKASSILSKVTTLAKGIAGKTWQAIVKIKDYALTPLNKIKNALFNIKTLAAAVFAGVATKQLVMNPINLADAYSSAQIGFSTLLGEKGGQEMMDQIDAFAKATPFKTSGVISNVQKMMAYGWDTDRIIKDMDTIGDAAAATGKGDAGLESIVYALSEIRSKGKLSTQELNQLASAGIKAKAYLAEGLGYGTDDAGMAKLAKDLEKGAIGANQAIDLILQGMEEFDGMMDKTANETVEGLWSQIQDTFEINILRKWGQGLQDGAKRGLGSIVSLLDTADTALAEFGDTIYGVGKALSNWAADKLEKAVKTIKEVTNTDVFKNAGLGGKVKILWDEVIAEPLSAWWNSTGKKKVAEIASSLGKTLGTGITGGLLVLLGLDAESAIADGVSIGGSFMEGFLEGFDTEKITKALSDWVSNNKGLATVLGSVLAFKLASGVGNFVGNIKNLFPGKSGGSGSGSGLGSYATATMDVTAGVVNVYGSKMNRPSDIVDNATDAYQTYKTAQVANKTKKLLTAGDKVDDVVDGTKLLTAGNKVDDVVDGAKLIGSADDAVDMAKLFKGAGTAKKLYTYTDAAGDVIGTTSKFKAFTGKAGSAVAKMFPKASKFATKAAPWLAALDFAIDGVSGYTKAKREGDSTGQSVGKGVVKSLAGDYEATGVGGRIWSTASNMLKGAGFGLAVGGPIGAIIGAGAGLSTNVGAQLANSNAPEGVKKAVSIIDPIAGLTMAATEAAEDPKAFKEKMSKLFKETIPEKWNGFWNKVGGFFTETIPTAWDTLTEKVSNFFTETIPSAWDSFWESVGTFFTETVPYALGYATGKVLIFFTETIPDAWDKFWGAIETFFTETVPYAIGYVTAKVINFFTETLPAAWNSFWDAIGTFFTETIPAWADTVWNGYVVPFFTETLPAAWDSFWGAIGTFFTETIPAWADTVWNGHIVPFFTETIPTVWDNFWAAIGTFFTETLPAWAESTWTGHIVPFFTETVPNWFSNLWDSVVTLFNEAVDGFVENIWTPIKTFFTDTIPGWVSTVWDKVTGWFDNIKDNFMSGLEEGSGGKYGGKKARGGIVGGSSSFEAFARGGMIDGFSNGGMVAGGSRIIKVAEEGSPEMIIPLSHQRRERGLKLWAKAGQMMGVPGFARGGIVGGNDEGIRFQRYGSVESEGGKNVVIEVGGIKVEIHIDARDAENIVETIKAKAAEIAEVVAGELADALDGQFANTPVKGGVA